MVMMHTTPWGKKNIAQRSKPRLLLSVVVVCVVVETRVKKQHDTVLQNVCLPTEYYIHYTGQGDIIHS